MPTALDDFELWYYTPGIPPAVIACIIFSFLTIYHIYCLVKSRKWFCIPFIVGGLFEVIGYAARAAAHNNLEALPPYIIQYLLLLVAPPLFAASIYMIFGRIIMATKAESCSLVRVKWVTKIFVCSDVICFLVQMGGGGIQASGNGANFTLGEDIVLGGLILQIVVFVFFVIVAGVFHKRLRRTPTLESLDTNLSWERLMWILYGVSALITIRNLIRVIEYGTGSHGYLLRHEWTLYIFDGLLMAVVLATCTTWYTTSLRPRQKSLDAYPLEAQEEQTKSRS